jgi:hypothetical protein
MGRTEGLEEARRERRISQDKRAEAESLGATLHDMRAENHIRPLLRQLIRESNDSKE